MSAADLRSRLRTVHVIPLTPFDDGGEKLAVDVFDRHVRRLVGAGVSMLICGAGTGEFHALRPEELGDLVRVATRAVDGNCLVWGAIGLGLHHALACGAAILNAGGGGVMVMPPLGPYLSDEGLERYYRALLDDLDCCMAIYKRGPLPSDELLLRLAEDERVVAVKYATDDVLALARVAAAGHEVEWICGSAERWAPYYALGGATGFTSGTANLVPRLSLKLQAALAAGDYATAMRLQRLFVPLEDFRARGATSYNIVALKHAMGHLGAAFGPARPPMRVLSAAEGAEVDAMAEALLAAEQAECG